MIAFFKFLESKPGFHVWKTDILSIILLKYKLFRGLEFVEKTFVILLIRKQIVFQKHTCINILF